MTQKRFKTFALLAALGRRVVTGRMRQEGGQSDATTSARTRTRRTDSHSSGQPQRDSAGTTVRTDVANQQCQ